MKYDVGIIGLGAMGSAAAWRLAEARASVIGLEQFQLGHDKGSSHGETRIIRSVYAEGAIYAPLVRAAYAGWAEIEGVHGRKFLHTTGGLDISVRPGGIFDQALASAQAMGAEHEAMSAAAITNRWPALQPPREARAVYAPDSGILESDLATDWMRKRAGKLGAVLKGETQVTGWRRSADGFAIETSGGVYSARKLVIAAGAWTSALLPALQDVLIPERQVIAWYEAGAAEGQGLPAVQFETGMGQRYYFFPPHRGAGIKAGLYHHRFERGARHIAPRGPDAEDQRQLETGLALCLPDLNRTPKRLMECRFTLAPDNRFILGPMPGQEDLILLSPCSGHGYKFAPAIGDIAARLALEKPPELNLAPFAVERVVQ